MEKERETKALETESEQHAFIRKRQYNMQLRTQMTDKEMLRGRQTHQVAFEKQAVDCQIQRLIQEDLRRIEVEKTKKELAFADMQAALAEKEQQRRAELEKSKAEEAKFRQYASTAEQRNMEVQEKKTQLEQNKQAIYEALRKDKEEKEEKSEARRRERGKATNQGN